MRKLKCAAGRWLGAVSMVALHEGDQASARSTLELQTELVSRYRYEPLGSRTQEIRDRIPCHYAALCATWEALQHPGWNEAQLAKLQTDWDSFNLLDQWVEAMNMDRALEDALFPTTIQSVSNISYFVYNPKPGGGHYYDFGQTLLNPRRGASLFSRQVPRDTGGGNGRAHTGRNWPPMQIMQAALETASGSARQRRPFPGISRLPAERSPIFCTARRRRIHRSSLRKMMEADGLNSCWKSPSTKPSGAWWLPSSRWNAIGSVTGNIRSDWRTWPANSCPQCRSISCDGKRPCATGERTTAHFCFIPLGWTATMMAAMVRYCPNLVGCGLTPATQSGPRPRRLSRSGSIRLP